MDIWRRKASRPAVKVSSLKGRWFAALASRNTSIFKEQSCSNTFQVLNYNYSPNVTLESSSVSERFSDLQYPTQRPMPNSTPKSISIGSLPNRFPFVNVEVSIVVRCFKLLLKNMLWQIRSSLPACTLHEHSPQLPQLLPLLFLLKTPSRLKRVPTSHPLVSLARPHRPKACEDKWVVKARMVLALFSHPHTW